MNAATEKNAQALKTLLGDAALAARLNSTRIAVITPGNHLPASGRLLAEVTADLLGRLWHNIDFTGLDAQWQLEIAKSAAQSGGASEAGFCNQWNPPYDCVISIGGPAPSNIGPTIQVAANDWQVQLGVDASCGNSENPVGPAFAAALATAQLFHTIFSPELSGINATLLASCSIDILQLFNAPNVTVAPLNLDETYVFGVGAVTHGFGWLLERWPEPIEGQLSLIDRDNYGASNGQRYAFMQAANQGRSKVEAVKQRLSTAHPKLIVQHYQTDLNSFCADRGYDQPLHRVITGLDSAESRRHAALKMPERTVNMWTDGMRIGAGRYRPVDGAACLACGYLEKIDSPMDEVAEFSQQTGMLPDVIRSLLDSGRGLTEQEASPLAARYGLQVGKFIGEPLRSVIPVLCATGQVHFHNQAEATDVPLAFASLFAGIAGFVMLLKDLSNNEINSYEWTQHIFKSPTQFMYSNKYSKKECICCRLLRSLSAA
jgi:hypothetical protein